MVGQFVMECLLYPPPITSYLAKMSPKTKENRPQSVSEAGFGAVGESRTHTPQRTTAWFGTANILRNLENANFLCKTAKKEGASQACSLYVKCGLY